jgi:hypothetical protein
MAMHLQGNSFLAETDYLGATDNFLSALTSYIKGNDFENFRTISDGLIEHCFTQITKSDLVDIFHKKDISQDDYFKELNELDRNNIVKQIIRELKYSAEKLSDKKLSDKK